MDKNNSHKKNIKRFGVVFFLLGLFFCGDLWAQSALPQVSMTIGGEGEGETATAVKIFLFLTLISVGPAIILTMTSFTRIIIVLSFLRQAIGVQQSPPNQVVVGLALFLTVFMMGPVFNTVYEDSIQPFMEDQIDEKTALEKASAPLKKFMFKQTRKSDLELLIKLSKSPIPKDLEALPMTVMIPSFVLSELKTAFEIGFLIYLPFLLIDMVISMTLLTMGMMMLPPIIISLPFKLMLFVLVDGWGLVIGSLMGSFK